MIGALFLTGRHRRKDGSALRWHDNTRGIWLRKATSRNGNEAQEFGDDVGVCSFVLDKGTEWFLNEVHEPRLGRDDHLLGPAATGLSLALSHTSTNSSASSSSQSIFSPYIQLS